MATFLKLVKIAGKYGAKAIKWVWAHKWEIIALGDAAIDWVLSIIGNM